jgi:hypothetical protein
LAGGRHIVEKKERSRALHQDIVDTVVDEIPADAGIPAERGGNQGLGADAVGTGDQHRFNHCGELADGKTAAESPHGSEHLRAMGRTHSGGNHGFRLRGSGDIDTGGGILRRFVGHDNSWSKRA